MKNKKISAYSPSLLITKELNLKHVIFEENNITGVVAEASILIDKLTKTVKFKNILDLCCDSRAITKMALRSDIKRALCVDRNLKVEKEKFKR